MLYAAYVGAQDKGGTWLDLIRRHGEWLGLHPVTESRQLPDGRRFVSSHLVAAGTAAATPIRDDNRHLIVTTGAQPSADEGAARAASAWENLTELKSNQIKIGVALHSGEARVVVPPTTPEQFYYRRCGDGYGFANDLRLLMQWEPSHLDERGIYALLQYGAIPAPFSAIREIRRVPNGHVLTLLARSAEPSVECYFDLAAESQALNHSADPTGELWARLDSILGRVPPATVVYFSGGVDSGLMAARLAALGRSDVTLLNYVFESGDEEADLATRMARHLGLHYERVTYDGSRLAALLERIGEDYSLPYSDLSSIPTNLLVHASLPALAGARTVLEGTGADGTFGLGIRLPYWARLNRVPHGVRRWIGETYNWLGLWRSDGAAGYAANVVRRTAQMPLAEAAIVAHNALDGIAYAIPAPVHDAITAAFRDHIHVMSRGAEPRDRFSFLDVVHVCCGLYAVKAFEPLRMRGIETVFPFLEPALVCAGFAIGWEQKCAGGVAKRLLKDRLAESVPRDMVFRPKKGFRPPITEILASPAVQDFIGGVVLSNANPLLGFCDRSVLAAVLESTRRGDPLSTGVYQFVWTMLFVSGWLRQVGYVPP